MLKTTVIGNIGVDAVVRFANGKNVISFPIAHNEKFTDAQGVKHEKTTWVDCIIWRDKETSLAQYLKKGQLVYVEGTPSAEAYLQKETAEVRSSFKLSVRKLELLGGRDFKNDPNGGSSQKQNSTNPNTPVAETADPTANW